MNDMEYNYTFVHLDSKTYNCFKDKEVREYLAKWSLKESMKVKTFGFNEQFQIYKLKEFLAAFINDDVVRNCLSLEVGSHGKSTDVEFEQLSCSVTSMRFFDRLTDPESKIVTADGSIRKCLDTQIDEFYVTDKLRTVLLDRESDEYTLYSEGDRKQFLFRLFLHLCLGGQWCQYEDNINPYMKVTRTLYKDLVSVQKDVETNMILISSTVIKVLAKDANGVAYFPRNPENLQNFVYLIVNPFTRRVIVLSNSYEGDFCF